MRKNFGVIHCVAHCETCGWHYEMYKNAQALGAKHAKKYKHKVTVDIGIAGDYDGTDELENK